MALFSFFYYFDYTRFRYVTAYTESDGNVIVVMCRSANNWGTIKYASDDIDWIAVYDKTTDQCYFISSDFLGKVGRSIIKLRLTKPRNNQVKKVIWARDFTDW
ncbi:MAG: group I intron-associated PD-(D/E)XK endonuclease [Snowella sp.]